MSDLTRILELAGITEGLSSTDVRKTLTKEFWRPVTQNRNVEVWKHMDDPSIGEYVLHLSPSGDIDRIEYSTPLHPMFNRSFETLGQFLEHLHTIVNDTDLDMEKGSNMLRDIGKKLRGLGEKAPTIVSASTEPDGGINRKTANKMVDPKGYFQKNKNQNFGGKGSFYEHLKAVEKERAFSL